MIWFTLFFQQYWKQILILIMVVALLGGVYLKGRMDCKAKIQRETITIYEKYQEEKGKLDVKEQKISIDRKASPVNDKRDSCLLSNDPFETKCTE